LTVIHTLAEAEAGLTLDLLEVDLLEVLVVVDKVEILLLLLGQQMVLITLVVVEEAMAIVLGTVEQAAQE
jgi:hypothetical protein